MNISRFTKATVELSFVLSQFTRDGQTDGQTDTFAVGKPTLWQRGKNIMVSFFGHSVYIRKIN